MGDDKRFTPDRQQVELVISSPVENVCVRGAFFVLPPFHG